MTALSVRQRWALALILALALCLRVIYTLQSADNPYFANPTMDAAYHLDWAEALLAGQPFVEGAYFRAPVYPWFLALLLEVCDGNLLWVRFLQAGVGTLSVALVFAVARRAFGWTSAWLAALGAATYWMLIYFDAELLLPVLEVPSCLWVLLAGLRWSERPNAFRAWQWGLALGCAAIVRPNVLLLAPCLAVWLVGQSQAAWTARLRVLALGALGMLLPIAPITLHNGLVGKDWALISTQGGVNLWIGNNPQSNGQSAIVPGTRADWWGGYYDSIAQAEIAEGRELKGSEVSDHYVGRVLQWWREEPWSALRLLLHKLRLFLLRYELGNNQDEDFFALHFGPILRYLPLGWWCLAPLAALGLWWSRARWRELFVLHAFVLVYSASVVLFFVNARFRVPLLPPLLIFAAYALVQWYHALQQRQFPRVFQGLAISGLVAVPVFWAPEQLKRNDAQGWWQLGNAALEQGAPQEALELYQRALQEDASVARIHLGEALALDALARPQAAQASYERALRLGFQDPQLFESYFDFLMRQREWLAAQALADRYQAQHPKIVGAHYAAARVRYEAALANPNAPERAAQLEAAVPHFHQALSLKPRSTDQFRCALGLARTQEALGRPALALAAYRQALESSVVVDAWYLDALQRAWNLCREHEGAAAARALFEQHRARLSPEQAQRFQP